MNIYLVGCEYAGKTTLAGEIMQWAERTMGGTRHFHDHMTIPSSELLPEARASYQAVHPQVKERLLQIAEDFIDRLSLTNGEIKDIIKS